MTILLGCIADDFTGATDLANNLVRAGMRVVQTIGVPAGPLDTEVDAVGGAQVAHHRAGRGGGAIAASAALPAGAGRTAGLLDEAIARSDICRVGRSLFDRGYMHATAGNISVRLADR